MNSRVALALAISAGMALVVSGIFYQVAVRGRSSVPAPVEIGEVVVAARDLDIGAAIEATDLKVEPWPANRIPDGSFQQIDDVINRVTVSRVLINEPIVDRRLALPGSGVGLAPKVPEGMRAMAVRVDDVNGVAGFVLPEARVDVLLTGSPRNRAEIGQITRTILSNVRVISAGEHLAPDASGRTKRVPVVTLLLTPRQAEPAHPSKFPRPDSANPSQLHGPGATRNQGGAGAGAVHCRPAPQGRAQALASCSNRTSGATSADRSYSR